LIKCVAQQVSIDNDVHPPVVVTDIAKTQTAKPQKEKTAKRKPLLEKYKKIITKKSENNNIIEIKLVFCFSFRIKYLIK
jgi:hypothetical protein